MGKRRRNRNNVRNNNNNVATKEITAVSTVVAVTTTTQATKTEDKTATTNVATKETSTGASTYKTYYSSPKTNYDYKGRKNKTSYPEFVNLCKHTQSSLKTLLEKKLLSSGYTEVISGNGYIYAKGDIPVLLTAHMDTVHKLPVKDIYEYYDKEKKQHIISSPQGIGGDDRCGVYMILELIKTHKCSILFCEDEEIGCVGSSKFCDTPLIDDLSDLKYLIELDRANSDDAVFYDCENDEFTDFILTNSGYKDAWGSCSDISTLSPACKVASVNFSCGYYNAHTTSEYVIMEEMFNTIEMVRNLLDVECNQFEYIEKSYVFGYGKGYTGRCYSWDDYYYGGYYGDYYGNGKGYSKGYKSDYTNKYASDYSKNNDDEKLSRAKKKELRESYGVVDEKSLYIYIYDEQLEEIITYISNGTTSDEAFGKFFLANPTYCFGDVYDYEYYDVKVHEDGWYLY